MSHNLKFIRQMFRHLPIGNDLYDLYDLYESNQSRYMRLINLVILTEYHRDLYPDYKGADGDSIWLTHDLVETVLQA